MWNPMDECGKPNSKPTLWGFGMLFSTHIWSVIGDGMPGIATIEIPKAWHSGQSADIQEVQY